MTAVKERLQKKNILVILVLTGLFLVLAAVVHRTEILPRVEEGFPFWNGWFLFGAVILYAMLLGAYLGFFVFRAKLEYVFLLVGVCFSIVFNFLILPGSLPDEPDHIATAYYFSNRLMGIPEAGIGEGQDGIERESIYVRDTDVQFMNRFQLTPTLKEYHYVRDYSKETGVSDEWVSFGRSKYTENWITYIPTVLSTTICRLLGVNGVMTIFGGRIVQTAIWLLVFFFAIRIIPVGKGVVFLLAICPITVQQCMSYNYDSTAIEASILFFALLIRLLTTDRKVGIRDTVLLGILIFLLSSSKGGVYIPECLLVLLIPKDHYKSTRQRHVIRLIFLVAILLGFLWSTLGYLLVVLGFRENPLSGATVDYSSEISTYTLSDVLTHPGNALYVLINTLLIFADFYALGSVSGPLCWLTVGISRILGYAILLLMALAAVRTEKDEPVRKKHRWCIVFATILTFLMSAGAMMITWTDHGQNYITGLQGRYFTPLLPFIAFLFRRGNLVVRRDLSRELGFAGTGIAVLVVWNLLYSIRIVTM